MVRWRGSANQLLGEGKDSGRKFFVNGKLVFFKGRGILATEKAHGRKNTIGGI